MALIHGYKLNPCKCGSIETPDLDSDDMIMSWGVRCFDCKQFQHGPNWRCEEVVYEWNKENPLKE